MSAHCPVAELAAQLERLSAAHLALDRGHPQDEAARATLAAYYDERSAIAIRASYLTAHSPTGAALQVALAVSDADTLLACEFVNPADTEAMQGRMNRLLMKVTRYLEQNGGRVTANGGRL